MTYEAPVPRTRSLVEWQKVISAKVYAYSADGIYLPTWERTTTFNASRQTTMHDSVVPKFSRRRNSGEIFNNPMDKTTTVLDATPMNRNYTYINSDGSSGVTSMGTWFTKKPAFLWPPNSELIGAEDVAVTKSFSNVSSSTASLLVTIGEAAETKEMMLTLLKRLWKSREGISNLVYFYKLVTQTLEHGNVKDFKKLLELMKKSHKVTDFWLEVRYGILPLCYDLRSMIDTWTEKDRKRPKRQTFRASESFEHSDSDEVEIYDDPFRIRFKRSYVVSGRSRAGVLAAQRLGGFPDPWGLTKVPQAIVDLTTLSFALNWFFDVAETVAAWTPDPFWEPLTNWVVNSYDVYSLIETLSCKLENRLHVGNCWGESFVKRVTYKERIPRPKRDLIPHFRYQMNWKRYIDAVALTKRPLMNLVGDLKKVYRS